MLVAGWLTVHCSDGQPGAAAQPPGLECPQAATIYLHTLNLQLVSQISSHPTRLKQEPWQWAGDVF